MRMYFCILVAGVLMGFGAFYIVYWNLNLPTKWFNPLGEELCTLNAKGEEITLAPDAKYKTRYAEVCPSSEWYASF